MPTVIHPMLATPIERPFDDPEWLYEIKWDGYRAISFIEDKSVSWFPARKTISPEGSPNSMIFRSLSAPKPRILDGEVVALDENGRASFSLMQQRTGIRKAGRQGSHGSKNITSSIMLSIFSISTATICAAAAWRSASGYCARN